MPTLLLFMMFSAAGSFLGTILFFAGQDQYAEAARLRPGRDFVKEPLGCKIVEFRHWCTHKPDRCMVRARFSLGNSTFPFTDSDWGGNWAVQHFPEFHVGDHVPCWRPRFSPVPSSYACQSAQCVQIQDPAHTVAYLKSEGHRLGDPGLIITTLSVPVCLSSISLWFFRQYTMGPISGDAREVDVEQNSPFNEEDTHEASVE